MPVGIVPRGTTPRRSRGLQMRISTQDVFTISFRRRGDLAQGDRPPQAVEELLRFGGAGRISRRGMAAGAAIDVEQRRVVC